MKVLISRKLNVKIKDKNLLVFYYLLYISLCWLRIFRKLLFAGSEEISKIKKDEIKVALGQMKNHKSPDDNNIQCEMRRRRSKLDAYQPMEQAVFLRRCSTMDHLQTIKMLIVRTTTFFA